MTVAMSPMDTVFLAMFIAVAVLIVIGMLAAIGEEHYKPHKTSTRRDNHDHGGIGKKSL